MHTSALNIYWGNTAWGVCICRETEGITKPISTHDRHIQQQQHTHTHTGVTCTSGGNADAPRGSDTAGRPVHWWTAIASNSSPVITSYFEIEYKCNWMIS